MKERLDADVNQKTYAFVIKKFQRSLMRMRRVLDGPEAATLTLKSLPKVMKMAEDYKKSIASSRA